MTLSAKTATAQYASLTAPIGIFGGTFDPIHFGHLRSALELFEQLPLAEIRFIPCRQPPHRQSPVASPEQRLTLLQLAIADEPKFRIDRRELSRSGLSYMVDTLASLRAEQSNRPLCLMLGTDSFRGLSRWYRWDELIELAHLLVMKRPGESLPRDGPLGYSLAARSTQDPTQLEQQAAGLIVTLEVTQLDISATRIRAAIRAGKSARYLLPETVWEYIQEERLYSGVPHRPEK